MYINPTTPYALAGFAFDYFLKDHLGNTRSVITEEAETNPYPTLTFDGNSTAIANQNAIWDNSQGQSINVTGKQFSPLPVGFASTGTNGTYCGSAVKGPSTTIGAEKLIKVMARDQLNVSLNYTYSVANADNSSANGLNTLLTSLAYAILGNPSGVNPILEGSTTATALQSAQNTSSVNGFFNVTHQEVSNTTGGPPKAYLHVLLFNDQFVFDNVNSLVLPVTSAGLNASAQLYNAQPINIPKDGYAYIYFSNESNTVVYFDNFALTDIRGPILEENSYYPFGLTMAGISDKAIKTNYAQNKYRYNGKELQNQEFSDGTGLEEYDYGARFYDPQIARWSVIDPMTDKMRRFSPYNYGFDSPIRFLDPDGMTPGDFYDQKGNKVGTDGIDDKKKYVVTDKKEANAIEKTNKGGGTTQVSDVKSAVQLPSTTTLKETSNVLNETVKGGGLKEHSALVMKDGTVVEGKEGEIPKMKMGFRPHHRHCQQYLMEKQLTI